MKKILFTHSYFLRFDQKQWQLGRPYPPLGTLLAASVMRQKGYEVSLFDTMFAKTLNELSAQLVDYSPNYLFVNRQQKVDR